MRLQNHDGCIYRYDTRGIRFVHQPLEHWRAIPASHFMQTQQEGLHEESQVSGRMTLFGIILDAKVVIVRTS